MKYLMLIACLVVGGCSEDSVIELESEIIKIDSTYTLIKESTNVVYFDDGCSLPGFNDDYEFAYDLNNIYIIDWKYNVEFVKSYYILDGDSCYHINEEVYLNHATPKDYSVGMKYIGGFLYSELPANYKYI